MSYLVIILLIILDIYWVAAFSRSNKEIKEEIQNTRIWCNKLIDSLIEQETKTNEMLVKVLKDINDNKVSRDIMNISNNPEQCQYHKQVLDDMREEQNRISQSIEDIKTNQDEFMKKTIEKVKEFQGT